MADIDIEKLESEADSVETIDDTIDDDEKAKRRNTRHHLKTRRAIEQHMDKKRFRQEIDYLSDCDDLD